MKTLLPILLLLAGIAAAYAIVEHQPPLESHPAPVEPPLVAVIRAEPQALRLSVPSQGVVAPRTAIDWVADVAGKVVRLHPDFVAGGFFEAGEELLAIDPRDYDQAIVAAEARIAEAKRQVAQEEAEAEQARHEWRALGENRPSPLTLHEPQLAEARARLRAAEADLSQARLRRSRCELRAPFAGRVFSRQVGLGQYVQPGEKLARLYATDVAEIRLPVAPDQLAYLDLSLARRSGSRAAGPKVTLSAELGGVEQHWEGRVVRNEGAIDEATGLLHLVAEVREPYSASQPAPLLAGLFVRAEIEGRVQEPLFVLPPGAVDTSRQAKVVDSAQTLHIRHLDVVRSEPDRIVVKGGLSAGDQIVIAGVQVPVEGMKVRVETRPAPPQASK